MRIGEMLVRMGVLNREQVEAILDEQQAGNEPFGAIAERLLIEAPPMEGAMELYIGKLSRLFFASLREAAVEYQNLFTQNERKSGLRALFVYFF